MPESVFVDTGYILAFMRDRKGWRVFLTTLAQPVQQTSSPLLGAIGIDLNADHLAVCETDRFGNPIASLTIPLCTYGLDRHQTQARIGEAIKAVMAFACDKDKPLAIEQLDFAKKKATLEEGSRLVFCLSVDDLAGHMNARDACRRLDAGSPPARLEADFRIGRSRARGRRGA